MKQRREKGVKVRIWGPNKGENNKKRKQLFF